ncbi:hypothetical protein LTR62_003091 [Meristemomyces frigidus]|uniref:Uncharacterized protein n=1 Tax=Meristemomyces frigidus TaxID=1508187 RepID=A0AAN7YPY8_9PEZI|nr:hypothetical protein LTR62_003091 [Meristemomyces frigidus]
MDARAYLSSQGWLGDGHSLDQTGRGIKKPLLVSKKVDVLGIGLNKHQAVSDQWWLRAYDQGLKDFGSGKQSLLRQVQKHGVNRGGLYGRFVKGEGVAGTFGDSDGSAVSGTSTPVEVQPKIATAVSLDGIPSSTRLKRKPEGEGRDDKRSKKAKRTADDPRIKKLVRKAQRRGLIPRKSDDNVRPHEGLSPQKGDLGAIMKTLSASETYQKALKQSTSSREKSRKLGRKVIKREFERVARAHLYVAEPATTTEELAERRRRKEEKVAARLRKEGKMAEQKVKPGSEGTAGNLAQDTLSMSPAELAKYTRRAAKKGISVERYLKRLHAKQAAVDLVDTPATDEGGDV